jgi:hypothetical protein
VFAWLRGTLPRLRYDQFMTLGWKVLVPVSRVWIVLLIVAFLLSRNSAAQCDSAECPHEVPTAGSNYPLPHWTCWCGHCHPGALRWVLPCRPMAGYRRRRRTVMGLLDPVKGFHGHLLDHVQ